MEALERRSAAYHRAAAARARRLLGEATTPWVKQQLAEAMARHDQIAAEIDRASEPEANAAPAHGETGVVLSGTPGR
jgi:phosphodiesterase/alkaline phosphatase D-like protein